MPLELGLLGSPTSDDAQPPLEGVGVARRALARLVDLGLAALVIGAGGMVAVLGAAVLASDASTFAAIELLGNDDTGTGAKLRDSALGLLALTAMHTVCEWLHGSTPGKWLLGIRVVALDGTSAGLVAAAKRSVGFLVDQLFFGLVGVHRILNSPRAQRIGDEWAGTMVVRIRDTDPASRPSGWRFLAATVAGLGCCGLVSAAALGLVLGRLASQTAGDRVAIDSLRPLDDAPLLEGRPAVFALSISHTLASASAGRLRLYVVHGNDVAEHGSHPVTGRKGTTRLEARANLPQSLPGYSDPPLPRFVVELYPAQNEESPSAEHVRELARVRCLPPAAPGQICVD